MCRGHRFPFKAGESQDPGELQGWRDDGVAIRGWRSQDHWRLSPWSSWEAMVAETWVEAVGV